MIPLNKTAFMTVTASLKTGTSMLSSCIVGLIFSASGWIDGAYRLRQLKRAANNPVNR